MKTSLIIVAAGSGERFGQLKLFAQLAGKTLLEWSIELIQGLEIIDQMVLVVQSDNIVQVEAVLSQSTHQKIQVVAGGRERVYSVEAGLNICTGDIVLIHNVANPMAQPEDFRQLHEALLQEDLACFVGQPVVDTLRRVQDNKSETIDRSDVWRVQTPQGFRTETLRRFLNERGADEITDEITLFDDSDIPVRAFPSTPLNQKVTSPEDLELMERLLKQEILIGIGEDSHRFDDSGAIVLGGLRIDGVPKLKGNSDGDLILHSLFNAISSALGKRSIGPTADPMAEQGIIDSSRYLEVILKQMKELGYRVQNVSLSLECKQPKVEPLVESMKDSLSALLELDRRHIGITATSGEGLTSFGKGEGVKCACVITLARR